MSQFIFINCLLFLLRFMKFENTATVFSKVQTKKKVSGISLPIPQEANNVAPSIGLIPKFKILAPQKASERKCISTIYRSIRVYLITSTRALSFITIKEKNCQNKAWSRKNSDFFFNLSNCCGGSFTYTAIEFEFSLRVTYLLKIRHT